MTRKTAAALVARPHEPAMAFSIEEAVGIIGVSRAKLYKMIAEGALESIKIGRRRLIPRSAAEALIRRGA